ncbi:MAG TPA: AraC family ligand binding domain-containing protein [Gammaproteobacteria bacterium]|nr:AraC family ligand binding domain-containing protein [Gammaproteobacteria bacterium]
MATISDVSIIDSNAAEARRVESGLERTICSPSLCASNNLTVYRRTILAGNQFDVDADEDYHLVYVMGGAPDGLVHFDGESHTAEEGAGVLLAPGESAQFEATGSDLELLHMVTPKPPPAVESGLPGGPGYFFNRQTLRALSDASGGRVRRFCAESSVRLLDGSRLTPTNAIQAGEMHYKAGGASPYHLHKGTDANPEGAAHCYMTFKGRGKVDVGETSEEIEPGTLVYFPPGVPHQLHSHGGPLDYFEIQAWRSFKTTILSEDPLGLRWYYVPEKPGGELVEWNQS